jgi:hypothetical protein
MTNKERLHTLQARIKAVLDALNATPPPPPVPPESEPTPEPPKAPAVRPHEAHIVLGQMCCAEHEAQAFRPQTRRIAGLVPVESVLDLTNSLRRR